jgi:hypothetical protein
MTTTQYIGQTEKVEIYRQEETIIYYRNDAPPDEAKYMRVFNLPRSFFGDSSLWMRVTEAGDAVITESNNVLKQIVHFLSGISEVTIIYLMRDADNSIQIWTIANPLTDGVLDSIFDQELKIIQYFKDSVSLDFHVAPLSDEEFLKEQGAVLIYKRG